MLISVADKRAVFGLSPWVLRAVLNTVGLVLFSSLFGIGITNQEYVGFQTCIPLQKSYGFQNFFFGCPQMIMVADSGRLLLRNKFLINNTV